MTNLIGNAIKFTQHGKIVVRVKVPEQSGIEGAINSSLLLRFEVSDTGMGIPKVAQATLFDSFSQVDASTTRRFGGTGLGLAISKQLSELMGGNIGVESEEDIGSTFWFTVRLVDSSQPSGVATGSFD